ncbi:MAG: hypothetical protein R3E86_08525 [Pseudomonadales bacterium]
MTDDISVRRRNRVQLIIIVLIAAVSLGGSYALFYMSRGGEPWGTTNRGEFVSPPLSLADLNVRDGSGQPMTEGETWWLWVVAGAPQPSGSACGADCAQAVYMVRQLHVLLNKDADRVQRALVTLDGAPDPALSEQFPKLRYLAADTGRLRPGIYIVDPIGNLVLRYEYAAAGKPVLEDLKKLLKVSQIG